MGLFDVFSGSGGRRAANQGYKAQKEGFNQANDLLRAGREDAVNALNQGEQEAYGYLDTGVSQASPYLQNALTPFQGLYDRGTAGIDYYGQLAGLGGGDPAQMQAMLEGIPGYQFARDQGLQALDRQANAKGNPYNATDVLNFTNGLASQNYFNYLNAFNPYFGLAQSGAQGLASGNRDLANLYNQLGANKANIATGTGNQLADVHTGAFTNLANNARGLGQAGYDRSMNAYNADQAANQNLWGAILGLGNAAIGAI